MKFVSEFFSTRTNWLGSPLVSNKLNTPIQGCFGYTESLTLFKGDSAKGHFYCIYVIFYLLYHSIYTIFKFHLRVDIQYNL